MSIEVRILKPEEFDLVAEASGCDPDPERTIVVAALDHGRVVGHVFVVLIPHLEALWIDYNHRGGTILSRLEKVALRAAQASGIAKIFALSEPHTEDYIERLGYTVSRSKQYEKEVVT